MMPTVRKIAEFWSHTDTFEPPDMYEPDNLKCFACGLPAPNLDRCHLIPRGAGGSDLPSNLVLLCKRCHAAAPNVGISAQPMIQWIQARENYILWMLRRATEECIALRPTALEEFASLGWTYDEFKTSCAEVIDFLRVVNHPGGEPFATIAVVMTSILQLRETLQRSRRLTQ
jgi:hypothetical protein